MKNFQSLSCLLATIVFLFIPEPSYGKESKLKCIDEIDLFGKAIKEKPHYFLVLLDDKDKKFELPFTQVKGEAFYEPDLILFSFEKYGVTYQYVIHRKTLKFSQFIKRTDNDSVQQLWKGSCKIVSPASGGKNLI